MRPGWITAAALFILISLQGCAGLYSSDHSTSPVGAANPRTNTHTTGSDQHDLWSRLRGGFALPHPVEQARVSDNLRWYADRPDFIARVADRAEPYLYYITEQVEGRGMPTELALLPVVESAFQPMAYSPSHASGLWQFIPNTGRHYGLKQNWWYDGRRDIHASTQAALDYLDKLHNDFNGDWLLAIAAYNCGEGCVQRAVDRNARLGRPTDFWSLDLPEETENYVPRLLAISALVAEPERYGIALRKIANEPYLASVDVGSQIDLRLAADLADMPLDELCQLNPGFNRLATDPAGPHRLLLPLDREQAFEERLASLPAAQRTRTRTAEHQVCRGETLYDIARQYNIDPALLRELNQLPGTHLQVGDTLMIPSGGQALPNPLLAQTQPRQPAPPAVREPAPQPAPHQTHTVAKGETLWSIARHYGVKTDTLAQWNALQSGATLRPGQPLVVQRAGMKTAARTVNYQVKPGDSLIQISRRFKVSIADLRRWNAIPEKHTLMPGQKIRVYAEES